MEVFVENQDMTRSSEDTIGPAAPIEKGRLQQPGALYSLSPSTRERIFHNFQLEKEKHLVQEQSKLGINDTHCVDTTATLARTDKR